MPSAIPCRPTRRPAAARTALLRATVDTATRHPRRPRVRRCRREEGSVTKDGKEAPIKGVLVCGLGRFGSSTAEALVRLGHDVLAIDRDPKIVQEMAGRLTRVVEADTANEEALAELGSQEFGLAVVGIGTSI